MPPRVDLVVTGPGLSRGFVELDLCGAAAARPNRDATLPRGHRTPDIDSLPCSAVCGVARVVDIVTRSRSKWFYRPEDGSTNYGWVLVDVRVLKRPIPCKGALGLWDLPPNVVRAIKRQLPRLRLD